MNSERIGTVSVVLVLTLFAVGGFRSRQLCVFIVFSVVLILALFILPRLLRGRGRLGRRGGAEGGASGGAGYYGGSEGTSDDRGVNDGGGGLVEAAAMVGEVATEAAVGEETKRLRG